jgi:hypothetical protein
VDNSKCLNSCFGLFADIDSTAKPQTLFGSQPFADLVEEYEKYKRGGEKKRRS